MICELFFVWKVILRVSLRVGIVYVFSVESNDYFFVAFAIEIARNLNY